MAHIIIPQTEIHVVAFRHNEKEKSPRKPTADMDPNAPYILNSEGRPIMKGQFVERELVFFDQIGRLYNEGGTTLDEVVHLTDKGRDAARKEGSRATDGPYDRVIAIGSPFFRVRESLVNFFIGANIDIQHPEFYFFPDYSLSLRGFRPRINPRSSRQKDPVPIRSTLDCLDKLHYRELRREGRDEDAFKWNDPFTPEYKGDQKANEWVLDMFTHNFFERYKSRLERAVSLGIPAQAALTHTRQNVQDAFEYNPDGHKTLLVIGGHGPFIDAYAHALMPGNIQVNPVEPKGKDDDKDRAFVTLKDYLGAFEMGEMVIGRITPSQVSIGMKGRHFFYTPKQLYAECNRLDTMMANHRQRTSPERLQ